jgi:hypothetical protein
MQVRPGFYLTFLLIVVGSLRPSDYASVIHDGTDENIGGKKMYYKKKLTIVLCCKVVKFIKFESSSHHSPLSTHRSPLAALHSPLATHRSPLAALHSPLATHHSPLPYYSHLKY